jgi:hypothetical protein
MQNIQLVLPNNSVVIKTFLKEHKGNQILISIENKTKPQVSKGKMSPYGVNIVQ